MQRHQLEHIIRAAAGITGTAEVIVVGSQAVLGQHPEAPAELLMSIEADVFTLRNPSDSDLIEGCIGEGSPFHQTFGYYAHGVGPDTATLPNGWKERLVPVRNQNTGSGTGLCLETHDLAVSKLVAAREKDLTFVATLLRYGLASSQVIQRRLGETQLDATRHELCVARLKRLST